MRHWIALVVLFGSAALFEPAAARQDAVVQSDQNARTYLEAALSFIRQTAQSAQTANLDYLEAQAHAAISNARDSIDTYGVIVHVLVELGDRHSFLSPSPSNATEYLRRHGARFDAEARGFRRQRVTDFGDREAPSGARLLGAASVMSVVVPAFSGPRAASQAYSRSLREIIETESAQTCGYIIDLRGNGGGNMWPMLAGVAPLLGDGPNGAFLNDGEIQQWFVQGETVGTQMLKYSRWTVRASTTVSPASLSPY